MSKNQQISSFLGFYFIVGTPLSEAISYLLQYDHVIPAADARRLINNNNNNYYYYYYYYCGVAYESVHSLARGHVIRVWLMIISMFYKVQIIYKSVSQNVCSKKMK